MCIEREKKIYIYIYIDVFLSLNTQTIIDCKNKIGCVLRERKKIFMYIYFDSLIEDNIYIGALRDKGALTCILGEFVNSMGEHFNQY